MNTKNILAVPLIAGAVIYQTVTAFPPSLRAEAPARYQSPPAPERQREAPQPEQKSPPPPPQAPANPVPPPPPEYPVWMPMHYDMPMHYRMLEPEMIYGYQLMTPNERIEYMRRIHSARSFEERDRLRLEHHRIMQERARKRGLLLPDMPGPGPRGRWR